MKEPVQPSGPSFIRNYTKMLQLKGEATPN